MAKVPLWIQGSLRIDCHVAQRGMYIPRRRLPSDSSLLDRIGYVEFRAIDLVEKALALSGTVVMGLPIMVQLTESERNKLHPGDG